jgi:hypothetical protein
VGIQTEDLGRVDKSEQRAARPGVIPAYTDELAAADLAANDAQQRQQIANITFKQYGLGGQDPKKL